jgi:hypothetical protein
VVARVGLAPDLHYCSAEDNNGEYLGGLIMAMMDYVEDGKTAHKQYGGRRHPGMVYNSVERAIKLLHGEEIVFGDLWGLDIWVQRDGAVKMADFD